MSNERLNKTTDILRRALPMMARYEIPVIPENYAVWFAHVDGQNPELSAALNRLIDSGKANEEHTQTLYQQFLKDDEHASLEAARESLNSLANEVAETLSSADTQAEQYGQALEECSSKIGDDLDEQGLRALIDDLSASTQSMQDNGQAMQESLRQSQREAEQLREELQKARVEARTDGLTGLANRKAFDAALENIFLDKDPESPGHCLIMADIDKFKSINDTYGHLLGDKVIKVVAETIKKIVKGGDLPCRFGGEEFVVLLPDTPVEGAQKVAESIRRSLERSRIIKPKTGEALRQVTISLGVTRLIPDEDGNSAIERADAALYRAKEGGRNRVETNLPAPEDIETTEQAMPA